MNQFFALTLPPDVQQFVGQTVTRWRRLLPADFPARWYAPEDCHITLKFLGSVPPERQAQLIQAAAAVAECAAPVSVTLAACGGFPDLRRPFVLWAGVGRDDALASLAGQLDQAMTLFGYALERRAYTPHITLARCRVTRRETLLAVPDGNEQVFPCFQAGHFALMQTSPPDARPKGERRRYNIVQTFPLGSTHSSDAH